MTTRVEEAIKETKDDIVAMAREGKDAVMPKSQRKKAVAWCITSAVVGACIAAAILILI